MLFSIDQSVGGQFHRQLRFEIVKQKYRGLKTPVLLFFMVGATGFEPVASTV
jgi:hypothetical protein